MVGASQALPDLTPSRVPALACPLRYHREHVLRVGSGSGWSRRAAYGSGLHAALKAALDPTDPTPRSERPSAAIVRRAFLGQYYESEVERLEDESAAVHSVDEYVARVPSDEAILGAEVFARRAICVSHECVVPFGTRFDALITRSTADGTLVVRDYKACSPRGVCLESAAVTYAVARASLARWSDESGADLTDVIVEYDFIGRNGLEGRTVLRRDDLRMVWDEVKTRAADIYGRGEVAARRGKHCAWCPYRASCDGLASAPDVDGVDPFDA